MSNWHLNIPGTIYSILIKLRKSRWCNDIKWLCNGNSTVWKWDYSAVVWRMVQISVHKLQFTGYGWHPWILIPTRPGAHLLYSTDSHGLNFTIFFIIQKSKFTERYNICSNWLLLQSIKGTCFPQMLNIFVNFDFCIMKKLWDLAHWATGEY